MRKLTKEPLVRISKRDGMKWYASWGIRFAAILLALLLNALFLYLIAGLSPAEVYETIFKGAFGNKIYRLDTLIYTAKLLCISVALAPAFKMRFWNVGAEGQVLMGALATAIVMVYFGSSLPTWALFTVMAVSAVVLGAIWGLIPAIFKANFGTNETLFTLMMNYVAIQLVDFYYNKWRGTKSALGMLNRSTKAGYLPKVFDSQYTIVLIAVAVLMVLMYFYLRKTKHGYEIAVVGESVNTAKYAGINVKKVIIRTMAISGAICGVCGFLTVSGQEHSIATTTAGGYGFTAIIVAWMAKFNTFYMALISLLLIALEKGTNHITDTYAVVNSNAPNISMGIILFFIIGSEFFINYKLSLRTKNEKEAA